MFSSLLDRVFSFFETISGVQSVKGMGAIPHSGGVFFRVWAPHAKAVYVTGSFDNWSKTTYRLRHEAHGYFSGNVILAKPGDEYRFYLKTPFGDFLRNDPYAKEMTHSQGNSIVHDTNFNWEEDHKFQIPNWNNLVIYEMHVGTFNRKNKNIPGDLYAAIEKLDYLQDLGVNAVELMPITEFPGDLSWGYNPAHPFAVEIHYGGPKALKEFIKAAHKKGIAVLIDVVYNHLGPSDLDLWQFDGWSEKNGGGIYFYNDWKAQTPWGHTRPDYGRKEVKQFLRDNALMWLEEFHADGLRLDMTAYIRNVFADGNPQNDIPDGHELLKWINHEVNHYYPHKIVIAEDMHQLDYVTESKEHGGLGFDAQWDSKFVHTIRAILIQPDDAHRDLLAAEQAILHKYNNNAFRRIIYTESHDEVANGKARLPEDIAPRKADSWFSKKKAALGITIVMTAPGIPMIFQGQPLLEDKWFSDTDPLDWQRLIQFKGNVKMYRDLIRLRRNWYNHTAGLRGQHVKTLYLNAAQGVLAYYRWENGGKRDGTVVVLNFKNQIQPQITIKFPIVGTWITRFNSDSNLYDTSYTNLGISHTTTNGEGWGNVLIAPYSALILSMD